VLRKEGHTHIFDKPRERGVAKADRAHAKPKKLSRCATDEADGSDVDEEDEEAAASVEEAERSKKQTTVLHPLLAERLIKALWKKEADALDLIYGRKRSLQPSLFFMRTMLVPPNRFRPPIELGDQKFEHPHTQYLERILKKSAALVATTQDDSKGAVGDGNAESESTAESVEKAKGKDGEMMQSWLALQNDVNAMIDSTKSKQREDAAGIRQVLEKKEGLLRKNMMGKRVNYAVHDSRTHACPGTRARARTHTHAGSGCTRDGS
jgi:DNA-directed RNA polymerase I subunit RPA1